MLHQRLLHRNFLTLFVLAALALVSLASFSEAGGGTNRQRASCA